MNKDLLHKYLSGTCTSHEEQRVEQWLSKSSQNEQTMEEIIQIWEVSPGKRIEVDTYKVWDALRAQHFSSEGVGRNPQGISHSGYYS